MERETVQAMQDLTGVSQQLKASSETMAENGGKVDQSVQEASARAAQVAASAEQVSASVQEVTAQITQMNGKTEELNKQAAGLDEFLLLVLQNEERMQLYKEAA